MRIDKREFTKDEKIDACIQAETLARLEIAGGRWNVTETENGYKVTWDCCKDRLGVDESDIIYSADTDCNSGTMSPIQAKKYADGNLEIIHEQLDRREWLKENYK